MSELAEKHAVVTGGGRGIGAAIAAALAQGGARVTLMGRTRQTLADRAAELGGSEKARAVEVDVTDPESVGRAFEEAARAFGPVSILVNNAGQAGSATLARTDFALWQRMIAVNMTGTFLCSQAALPGMRKEAYGRIVNVASTAGLTGYAYVTAYCAAKHGVVGFTRALAIELAKTSVTVNAVCPGYTESDLVDEAVANITKQTGRSREEARAELARKNPQARLLVPEEVADAVVWLCRPGSSSITGQSISVSGGEIM